MVVLGMYFSPFKYFGVCHGRACPLKSGLPDLQNSGKPEFWKHPRLASCCFLAAASKTWMAGTSGAKTALRAFRPAMTVVRVGVCARLLLLRRLGVVPRIIGRVDIVDRKRAHAMDLDDRGAGRPAIVLHPFLGVDEPSGPQGLAFLRVELVTHSD